jgi:hypothetical protein
MGPGTGMASEDPTARKWLDYFMSQPGSEAKDGAVEIPEAQSFVVEVHGEDILLRVRFADGRERAFKMVPDVALFLREYLTVALKSTEAYGRSEP